MRDPSKPGFYWVRIAFDPDTDDEWVNQEQPARYNGNGEWQVIGSPDWPVIWWGDEIVSPFLPTPPRD